jgi:hypothetical protein
MTDAATRTDTVALVVDAVTAQPEGIAPVINAAASLSTPVTDTGAPVVSGVAEPKFAIAASSLTAVRSIASSLEPIAPVVQTPTPLIDTSTAPQTRVVESIMPFVETAAGPVATTLATGSATAAIISAVLGNDVTAQLVDASTPVFEAGRSSIAPVAAASKPIALTGTGLPEPGGSSSFSNGLHFPDAGLLLVLLGLAALGLGLRLAASAAYRPLIFISLLERPG